MDNTIEISPILSRSASPTDLLKPRGKLSMAPLNIESNFFDNSGTLFIVDGPNFNFHFSVDSNGLYVKRNGHTCSLKPSMFPNGKLVFFLMSWNPTELKLLSGYKEKEKVVEVLQTTNTPSTTAPLSLKRWAREKSLLKKTIYKSVEELRDSVYQCLSDLKDKIEDSGSGDSFFDYVYDGNKVIEKNPKKEPLTQPLLLPILNTELFLRGIEIFRENTTPSGDVDFTVTGAVEGLGSSNMAIELKNAHSGKLENGLLNQLPDYMRSQNSEYGAYVVLNYNIDGDRSTRAELIQKLNLLQLKSNDNLVQTKIRIFVIDLDKKIVQLKRK